MIPLAAIRDRLRTLVTDLVSVEGAATLATLESFAYTPAAYVLHSAESAGANTRVNAVAHRVTAQFSVLLAVRNLRDPKGDAAVDECEDLRSQVRAALVGWQPTPDSEQIELGGGELLSFDDQVLLWVEQYRCSYYLTG